MDPAERRLIR
jgi:hypothetical protein